jgi:hypothetical protein
MSHKTLLESSKHMFLKEINILTKYTSLYQTYRDIKLKYFT